ncbi:S-ribosylhomocysteine lyase, partial [uncultured Muribaculum sp.]
ADFEGDIPGASPRDCGNYTYMDLPEAKKEALKYLEEILDNITPQQLNYPD